MAERTSPERLPREPGPVRLFWTRRTSLTARILAVNVIALGLMAGSLFYLARYRAQLLADWSLPMAWPKRPSAVAAP